jgi:putative tryptophan/tyrosine transport system substrate-binding protein
MDCVWQQSRDSGHTRTGDRLKRREFLTLIGGAAAAWPDVAQAQRIRRIGVLIPYVESDAESQAHRTAFVTALQKLGWTDPGNVKIDFRWTDGDSSRIPVLAKELLALQPDVMLCRATPPTVAVLRETKTVPIVFVGVSDPVGDGLVASIARPGGNVTGFTNVESSLGSKWVGLLKEFLPRVARVAVMFNPKTAGGGGGSYYVRLIEDAAKSIALNVMVTPISKAEDIDPVIAMTAREPNSALLVLPDVTNTVHWEAIVTSAARHSLPAIYPYRHFALDGGLMSYGVEFADLYRRAASYIDRILRGEKPADLAVQLPNKFDFVINLKTAKALGLNVSPTLIALTDDLVE